MQKKSAEKTDAVLRSVLDIGSGKIRMNVADVNPSTNKIMTTYFTKSLPVLLGENLKNSADKTLSPEIQHELIKAIHTLKEEASKKLKEQSPSIALPTSFGFGTDVFRKAKNASEVIQHVKKETGIEIRSISQEEEGRLGFYTCVEACGKKPEDIIAWDLGSGSFQISTLTDGQVTIFGSPLGATTATKLLCDMRKMDTIPEMINPVSLEETVKLSEQIRSKLSSIPDWLKQNNKEIIGFGGDDDLFAAGKRATGKNPFTAEHLKKAVEEFAGKSEDDLRKTFPKPREVLVILTLLYSIMEHYSIKQVQHQVSSGGCTTGALLMPQYWQN